MSKQLFPNDRHNTLLRLLLTFTSVGYSPNNNSAPDSVNSSPSIAVVIKPQLYYPLQLKLHLCSSSPHQFRVQIAFIWSSYYSSHFTVLYTYNYNGQYYVTITTLLFNMTLSS